MQDLTKFPNQGLNPLPLQRKHRVLTPRQPETFLWYLLKPNDEIKKAKVCTVLIAGPLFNQLFQAWT